MVKWGMPLLAVISIGSTMYIYDASTCPTPLILEAIGKKDPETAKKLSASEKKDPITSNYEYFMAFGKAYRTEFLEMAKKYNLPPEIILAVFQPELMAQNKYTKLGDDIATYVPFWNPSIGLGQVRINTALELAKHFGIMITRSEIVKKINTPEGAIEYVAMYLRRTIDNTDIGSAYGMIFHPEKIAELYSYYVGGEHPNQEAMISGFGLLVPFKDENFYRIFGTMNEHERKCAVTAVREYSEQTGEWLIVKLDSISGRYESLATIRGFRVSQRVEEVRDAIGTRVEMRTTSSCLRDSKLTDRTNKIGQEKPMEHKTWIANRDNIDENRKQFLRTTIQKRVWTHTTKREMHRQKKAAGRL